MRLFRRKRRSHFKNSQATDERRFRNPYLRAKGRGRGVARGLWLAATAVLGVLAAYIILFSPAFSILEISVAGASPAISDRAREIAHEYLNGRRWLFVPRRNSLFVEPEALAQDLRKSLTVASVTVERDGPHILRVLLTEMEPRYVMIAGGSSYLADKRGVIISPMDVPAAEKLAAVMIAEYLSATTTPFSSSATGTLPTAPLLPSQTATDTPRLPVVVFGQQKELKSGDQAARNEVAAALESAQSALGDYGLEILTVSLASGESWELSARTNEGWQVFLDAGADLEQQVSFLRTALKSSLRQREGLQYVDLRYGNRVFYK